MNDSLHGRGWVGWVGWVVGGPFSRTHARARAHTQENLSSTTQQSQPTQHKPAPDPRPSSLPRRRKARGAAPVLSPLPRSCRSRPPTLPGRPPRPLRRRSPGQRYQPVAIFRSGESHHTGNPDAALPNGTDSGGKHQLARSNLLSLHPGRPARSRVLVAAQLICGGVPLELRNVSHG